MIKQKIIFGIDRKEISHFTKIKLTQTINDHHFFKITVPQAVIEAQLAYTITKSQEWVGKTVHIQLENSNNFLGIIKYVKFVQKGDHVGNQIEISGYSKTDLLNSGKKRYSWENCTLKEIVESVLKKGVGNYRELKNEINPEYKHEIKYQTQYNETDFEFLQRLAKQYNEWFYYDCEKLIFGKPEKFDAMINLLFESDLSHLKIALQALPHKLSGYTYDENTDSLYKVETNEEVEGLTQLGKQVFKASEALYNTPDATQERISAGNEAGLEHSLNRKMQSIASETQYVIARSHNPKLKIGSLIAISAQEKLSYHKNANSQVPQYDTHGVGAYIITEITHKATDIGEYENRFKALPAHITKLPEPQIAEPIAKTQEALVIANNDPMNYGRIRVRMQWQYGGMQTPWLRVMSADAGSSTDVPTNRGNVFIPEVGDHVALNFWDDDPNKPFVIGSLFTGKTGRGGGANNDFRTITDGSGQYFELEKFKNIIISDKKGNKLHVDSVGDTLNITALKKINLFAEDITLNASNNIELNSGNNLEINVSKNMIMNVMTQLFVFTPALKQVVSGFMNLFSGKALINSSNAINIEAEEVTTFGTNKMLVHSDKLTTINSKEVSEMHGATKNSLTNTPLTVTTAPASSLTNVIVEFRTKQDGTYTGQFGFDWLRIDDNTLTHEKKYEDCLVNGYEKPNGKIVNPTTKRVTYRDSNTEYEAGEAFPALEKMYKQLPISRTSTPAVTKYYVPYLNLYPKPISDATPVQAGFPQPPFEADLRILIDVEGTDEPDQIRVVFDKRYFEINGLDGSDANPILISDKTIGTKREAPGTINIKCIGEFALNQEIKIYAYPKNSLTQTVAQQLVLRKLAGKTIVGANLNKPKVGKAKAVTNRKKLKVVLVQVKTNVSGTEAVGIFDPAEKINLQNALHQALIHGEIEEFVARDAHGVSQVDPVSGLPIEYLDLRTNPDFKVGGKFISGGLILRTEPTLNSTLRTLLSRNTSVDYSKYFYVFAFGINDSTGAVAGRVEDIGKKSVVLYPGRNPLTLGHETLHGLGLLHTHADGTITDSDQKFVFVHAHVDSTKGTDNFMSYNGALRKTTWKWQWDILKKHI